MTWHFQRRQSHGAADAASPEATTSRPVQRSSMQAQLTNAATSLAPGGNVKGLFAAFWVFFCGIMIPQSGHAGDCYVLPPGSTSFNYVSTNDLRSCLSNAGGYANSDPGGSAGFTPSNGSWSDSSGNTFVGIFHSCWANGINYLNAGPAGCLSHSSSANDFVLYFTWLNGTFAPAYSVPNIYNSSLVQSGVWNCVTNCPLYYRRHRRHPPPLPGPGAPR
jgi:hypothetical protein